VRRTADAGSVLVEMVIVIVVLGVLSALGIRVVHGFSAFSSTTSCRSDKRNVQSAVAAYYAEHGGWAASVDALVTAGLLAGRPEGGSYTITYDGAGKVTAAGACT
jgi:competence protein ComGC